MAVQLPPLAHAVEKVPLAVGMPQAHQRARPLGGIGRTSARYRGDPGAARLPRSLGAALDQPQTRHLWVNSTLNRAKQLSS